MPQFVHLHAHSHYSLLDGLGRIDQLIAQAKEYKMPALALTDHGVMYGAIEFYEKCREADIKPIVGVEFYLARRSHLDKTPKIDASPHHLTVLAKNETGYKNLIKLTTLAHLKGYYYKPRVDKKLLKEYSEGLMALSGCLAAEIPRAIANNLKEEGVKKIILEYQEIFDPGNFYLEIQSHPEIPEQNKVDQTLIALSQKLNIPLVATNDIHYIKETDKEAHEVLLAVQTKKEVDDTERLSFRGSDFSMLSSDEMAQRFKDTPAAIDNSLKIAEQCELKLELDKTIMPDFELPPGHSEKILYLRFLCQNGFKKKYGEGNEKASAAKARLEYELMVIENTDFIDYFLIVQDFVNWAKSQGILVGPGRGSAAGSIVSYLLNITDIDPLKYNLLFERFLNPDRVAPPDIDLDFPDDRRAEVIEYIANKYGHDHMAQIITFGVMKARLAVRDVTRALGLPYSLGDRLAKLIPFGLTLEEALKTNKELKQIYETNAEAKRILEMSFQLEGVVRHASMHAAGIVLSREPLDNYAPLQFAPRGEQGIITQYSMYDVEKIGLLKIDILGLANLTIIKNALRIIRKTKNIELDPSTFPQDDPKTFEFLAKAETTGVFQLESDGIKRHLKELRPSTFDDIVAMVALYRPGPMEWIPDYIASKHGRKKITYLHPKLEPILKDTLGIAVYQEQVMQIARDIAGFTLAEADILRKAVGKKIKKLLIEQRGKFIAGAQKQGVKKEIAEKLFSFIEPFARYGFNRAHATGYALIAFQTAYLKAHFPAEFMAALLTSEQNNLDKIAKAVSEAERMKIKVLPPDINESFPEFGVVGPYIRFGLAAIKNVGFGVAEKIAEEKKENGPYKNVADFALRLTSAVINKKVWENLVSAGALDSLGERNQLLAATDLILKTAGSKTYQKTEGQFDLFGSMKENPTASPTLSLPAVTPATKKQKLIWERDLLGIYLSEHPLKDYLPAIEQENPLPLNELKANQNVKVAGIITQAKQILTKNNEPMCFARLEDMSGNTELVVFPKIYQKETALWQTDNVLVAWGKTNIKDNQLKVLVEKAKNLNLAQNLGPTIVSENNHHEKSESEKNEPLVVSLPYNVSKDILEKLKELVAEFPGQTPLLLELRQNGRIKIVKTKSQVENILPFREKLKGILNG